MVSRRDFLKLVVASSGVLCSGGVGLARVRPLVERLRGRFDRDLMWACLDPRLELVPLGEEAEFIRECCYHGGKFWYPRRWIYDRSMPAGYHGAWLRSVEVSNGLERGSLDSVELRFGFYSNPNLLRLAIRYSGNS